MKSSPLLVVLALALFSSQAAALPNYVETKEPSGSSAGVTSTATASYPSGEGTSVAVTIPTATGTYVAPGGEGTNVATTVTETQTNIVETTVVVVDEDEYLTSTGPVDQGTTAQVTLPVTYPAEGGSTVAIPTCTPGSPGYDQGTGYCDGGQVVSTSVILPSPTNGYDYGYGPVPDAGTSAGVVIPTHDYGYGPAPDAGTSAGVVIPTHDYGYGPAPDAGTSAGVVIPTATSIPDYNGGCYGYGQEDCGVKPTTVIRTTLPPSTGTATGVGTPCITSTQLDPTTSTRFIEPSAVAIVTHRVTATLDGGAAVSVVPVTSVRIVTETETLTDTLILCRPTRTIVTQIATETAVFTATQVQQTTVVTTVPVVVTATQIQEVIQTVVQEEQFTEVVRVTQTSVALVTVRPTQVVTSTAQTTVTVTSTNVVTASSTNVATSTVTVTNTQTVTRTNTVSRTSTAVVTTTVSVIDNSQSRTPTPTPTTTPCETSTNTPIQTNTPDQVTPPQKEYKKGSY